MKYIRTKDGIIVDTVKRAKEYGMSVEEYESKFPYSYSIKADTIEELCDEFVFTDNNNSFYQVEPYNSVCGKDIVCYGAIWTEKGLIYVAKMNEKGTLELL